MLLMLGIAGCGADTEVEKSIGDVRELVEPLREAWDAEWKAVKDKRDPEEVKSAIEETTLQAQASVHDFERVSRRAPAETQDFADAAEDWCQAIIKFHANQQVSAGDDAGGVYLAAVYTYHNNMDLAAKEFDVKPWTPRKK